MYGTLLEAVGTAGRKGVKALEKGAIWLIPPYSGVSSGGTASGLCPRGWRGRRRFAERPLQEICGASPASPVRVKAGAPRVRKAEERSDAVHCS